MSATLFDLPGLAPHASGAADGEHAEGPVARRLTLERVVEGLWSDVRFGAGVACPMCAGAMHPQIGAGAVPVGARCADCHTTLT